MPIDPDAWTPRRVVIVAPRHLIVSLLPSIGLRGYAPSPGLAKTLLLEDVAITLAQEAAAGLFTEAIVWNQAGDQDQDIALKSLLLPGAPIYRSSGGEQMVRADVVYPAVLFLSSFINAALPDVRTTQPTVGLPLDEDKARAVPREPRATTAKPEPGRPGSPPPHIGPVKGGRATVQDNRPRVMALYDTVVSVLTEQGLNTSAQNRAIVLAIIENESGGSSRVTSNRGAKGVMQLMPDTFANYMGPNADPFDVRKNITAGVKFFFRVCLPAATKRKKDSVTPYIVAAAMYNAGPARINSPSPWPAETVAYASSVKVSFESIYQQLIKDHK